MIIKPDGTISSSSSSPPTSSIPGQTTCGECGVEDFRLLHHLRHRTAFRRLCTSCVLRFNPRLFCPSCFAVYASTPSSGVSCSKCKSSSHPECVGANYVGPYVCPLCVNPKSPVFFPKKVKDFVNENPEAAKEMIGRSGDYRVIDKRNAKILLAAAKISAESMSKAAMAARTEAERRAKDAAYTRKRARVALEHLAYLVAKEKIKKRPSSASGVRVGATVGVGNGSTVGNSGSNRSNGAVGSLNPAAVMRIGGGAKDEGEVGKAVRGDSSSEVLAALNAVELREKDKISGESSPANVGGVWPLNDADPMDIEETEEPNAVAKIIKEAVRNNTRFHTQPVKLSSNVSGGQ
ncbi:OLC1v1038693C1 [Oldenlandia corymbosa var. corymbosa]|uniref:OLC1v1038693C1 n=1 Tax=Oldenlandia corymbosa var. corymbosa TaxID=529605 RepID=A0AAV1D3J0_OLDCO|nr:OLC1v1038693C1 [Oldenlandia corymbosa var. corymbosa]